MGLLPSPPAAQTSKVPSSFAMNPRSLKVAWVSFLSELENVTLSFLGILMSVMMSNRYVSVALAYGYTSNFSPGSTPESDVAETFLGLSPPPPCVLIPWSSALSIISQIWSPRRLWSWTVSQVVVWILAIPYLLHSSMMNESLSLDMWPPHMRSLIIPSSPPFWA